MVYGRLVNQNDSSSRFFTRDSCMVRKINCLVWSLDLLAYSKLRWLFSLGKFFTNLERFKNRNSRVIEYVINTFTSNRMGQLCRKLVATLKKMRDIIGSSSYVRLVASNVY